MAVVTTKSTPITNRDATPTVINNAVLVKGTVLEAAGLVASVSGDSANSKYIYCEVPSNARVSSILSSSAALGGSAAMDIGVYRNSADGGAVVDADFFASALSLVTAINNVEVVHESGVNTIAKQMQPLWQALGMASDPKTTLDIVGTLTAASAANGDTALKVKFTV